MSVESKRVSAKQLRANRRNAERSTGPRTEEGKAWSARNATTHGTFCADLLLPGEDEAELRELRRGIYTSFSPQDFMERELVDRIVAAQWRLRRLRGAEREALMSSERRHLERTLSCVMSESRKRSLFDVLDEFSEGVRAYSEDQRARHPQDDEPITPAARLAMDLADGPFGVADRISVYQQRIEQSANRAMRELRQLRRDRREMGELPPCPYLEELERGNEDACNVVTEVTTPRRTEAQSDPSRGVVASATTSDENHAQPMSQNVARAENAQNEPISDAPRAADGADEGCEQASQDVVIIEPVKLCRAASNEPRDRAEEGPISPGA